MPVALRIVNDVSYAMRINHEIHFCVAGAVFAEVGGCFFVAPRFVNDVSYVMWINHEVLCSTGVVLE